MQPTLLHEKFPCVPQHSPLRSVGLILIAQACELFDKLLSEALHDGTDGGSKAPGMKIAQVMYIPFRRILRLGSLEVLHEAAKRGIPFPQVPAGWIRSS